MQATCLHCGQRMDVPDVYFDRVVRCTSCHKPFSPSGHAAASATVVEASNETTPDGPDWRVFQGVRTKHRVLVEMVEQAKAAGKQSQCHYLAAYCNAQTALKRDTWQAAAFEWHNALELLSLITNRRAADQVRRAKEVFRQLASDQIVDFAHELERELKQYYMRLPERAARQQGPKIADSLRKLVGKRYRDLVDPVVVRQVERSAERWARGPSVTRSMS